MSSSFAYEFRKVNGVWQRRRVGGNRRIWQTLRIEDRVIHYHGDDPSVPKEIKVRDWIWEDG